MHTGVASAMVGMKVGETREVQLTLPDNFEPAALRGVPVTCQVGISELFEYELAEVRALLATVQPCAASEYTGSCYDAYWPFLVGSGLVPQSSPVLFCPFSPLLLFIDFLFFSLLLLFIDFLFFLFIAVFSLSFLLFSSSRNFQCLTLRPPQADSMQGQLYCRCPITFACKRTVGNRHLICPSSPLHASYCLQLHTLMADAGYGNASVPWQHLAELSKLLQW